MVEYLSQFNIIFIGVAATLATGLATGVGALPIFFTKNISKKVLDALLGAAAGIMLAATSFSLILPAIERGGGGIRGASIALVGILAGGVFLDLVDKCFPNTNLAANLAEPVKNGRFFKFFKISPALRKVWIFVLAITVHNFPEGMAVGVGFGDGQIANGLTLAIGIGLQNIPEGLAVALPFLREGYPRWKAFLISLASGLAEPLGGLIGIAIVQFVRPFLPFSLAFAAGAMLFVIAREIIPESQLNQGHSRGATYALLVGYVVMMFLDTTLG